MRKFKVAVEADFGLTLTSFRATLTALADHYQDSDESIVFYSIEEMKQARDGLDSVIRDFGPRIGRQLDK